MHSLTTDFVHISTANIGPVNWACDEKRADKNGIGKYRTVDKGRVRMEDENGARCESLPSGNMVGCWKRMIFGRVAMVCMRRLQPTSCGTHFIIIHWPSSIFGESKWHYCLMYNCASSELACMVMRFSLHVLHIRVCLVTLAHIRNGKVSNKEIRKFSAKTLSAKP